ncbi:MAG: citrate transporter [Bacteroidetes bacterium]|nr:citrate transporter [Bacteroidota bacterium]
MIGPIRLEFILFGLTLIGVALFHKETMFVALTGLASILMMKLIYTADFSFYVHFIGDTHHEGEWRTLLNLLGLLFGFAILAKYFEESKVPEKLPDILPNDWKGGLVLLFAIMVLSSFLDNIAAAMIGGTIALVVFKGKVHIGYLAAIVAASNAGGAGSVVGDTTTTLMWIDGVSPLDVTHAFVASIASFVIFGFFGSIQQHKYQPIIKDAPTGIKIDGVRIMIVALILIGAILTNYFLDFPALGVWIGILIGAMLRPAPWEELKNAWMGTIFLLSLVTCASLMPVEELPAASWQSAFALGFVSAVFDNIPLTKLCLEQGGYDWGVLAYTVGFGGSMIWFGSSAGVALSNKFPETRSVFSYVKHGWHVTVAYIVGFFIMLGIVGWHPHAPHKKTAAVEHTEATIHVD